MTHVTQEQIQRMVDERNERQMQNIGRSVVSHLTTDEKNLLQVGFDIMAEYAEVEDTYNPNDQDFCEECLEGLTEWDEEDWFAAEAAMSGVDF